VIKKIRNIESRLCWPPLELRQVANLQKPLDTMKIELCTNACVNGQFRVKRQVVKVANRYIILLVNHLSI